MNTSYIVLGIVVLLFLILFSVKYVVADKYTLREMLNAKDEEKIAEAELPKMDGIAQNFTYSIWLYVNNWNYKNGEYKPIFGKFGDGATIDQEYFNGMDNCNILDSDVLSEEFNTVCNKKPSPVVTFDKYQNNIIIYMPCDESITGNTNIHKCMVQNIPIQKWVNLSITLYKKTLDIYINGKLHKTCVLPGIPDLQQGDIHLTPAGGFDGYTSKFQFYPEALNPQEIWNIYSNGYGSLASTLGDYQVKMSLIENGNETNSLTI